MEFDVYYPFTGKDGKKRPGVKPMRKQWHDIVKLSESGDIKQLIVKFRETKDGYIKTCLPAVCYMGKCYGTRAAANMEPTQVISIDIDHVSDPATAYLEVLRRCDRAWWTDNVLLVHITPSGHGLRFVVWAQEEFGGDVAEQIKGLSEKMSLGTCGDVDTPCKDLSRLSFMFNGDELLYASEQLSGDGKEINIISKGVAPSVEVPTAADDVLEFTDEEKIKYESYEYRGTLVKVIIEKWVEEKGAPVSGEVHNYYNNLIKNFRNITNNDKRALLYLLPRFGHTADECWSSIKSICRVNTLSSLPKEFYFFLKDNGYYGEKVASGEMAKYMLSDEEKSDSSPLPYMPPVFRELVGCAPRDFKVSAVNSLLPVMGTLTSFLEAEYYYDGRIHTTSFFSVIYAPAGTGKGFVGRYMDLLFTNLYNRDFIQQARENIFLKTMRTKGDSERAPEDPHISLRIIPAKNSEAEFLEKQRDNKGYHMFTYAAEMDSWAKGAKAAGGNKDDMIRVAWDNDEYGQQFKSANTFKGKVRLYWNVLITGTLQQLQSYFKNVENGLVTRCSFTTIPNQEFSAAPIWKPVSKKSAAVVQAFVDRCDKMTYTEPCTLVPDDLANVSDEEFDKEVNWRFNFRPKKRVDMGWLKATIDDFLESNRKKASLDFDKARDTFRRRAAVRGFRLGILCTALWEKPTRSQLEKCIPFIRWWMDNDLESTLKLWGAQYNNAVEDTPNLAQRNLYQNLGAKFTKNDVYVLCMKQGIKSPVRQIIYQWVKLGYVRKLSKNDFEKVK